MSKTRLARLRHGRRGAAVALVAVGMVTMMGFAALTIDVGMLYVARSELQVSADAAAMAGAWTMLNEDRLKSTSEMLAVYAQARQQAASYGAKNKVLRASPTIDLNSGNGPDGDIVLGYLSDPTNQAQQMSTTNPSQFNAVQVRVRRDETRNGPIDLLFARIFGYQTSNVSAEGWAAYADGVNGYRVTPQTGNAELLPLALHRNSWLSLLSGAVTVGDNYTYDSETGTVSAGADGIPELNLFPGAGSNQLPPGNFGTVDIGSPNNSTADIERQILYGVNATDLSYFGGELVIPPAGLSLNGDTGLSAAMKDELEAIKGKARAIPLFNQVSGPGNNAVFNIIGFAGIRVMNVKLTGPMSKKEVIIQPAYVVDDAALAGPSSGSSYFVYQPVRLVR